MKWHFQLIYSIYRLAYEEFSSAGFIIIDFFIQLWWNLLVNNFNKTIYCTSITTTQGWTYSVRFYYDLYCVCIFIKKFYLWVSRYREWDCPSLKSNFRATIYCRIFLVPSPFLPKAVYLIAIKSQILTDSRFTIII